MSVTVREREITCLIDYHCMCLLILVQHMFRRGEACRVETSLLSPWQRSCSASTLCMCVCVCLNEGMSCAGGDIETEKNSGWVCCTTEAVRIAVRSAGCS